MQATAIGLAIILTVSLAQDLEMNFVTVTLDAIADNTFFVGAAGNFGSTTDLIVGLTSPDSFRSMVKFDLSGSALENLEIGSLVSASLEMTRRRRDDPSEFVDAALCRTLNPMGCASVYTILAPWSETGSNWFDRDFSLQWSVSGGDFVTRPDHAILGQQTRDTGEDSSTFALNVTLVEFLIRNPQENHGFMLVNPGPDRVFANTYDSRECLGQPDNPSCNDEFSFCCRSGVPPQLILEFLVEDDTSTALPTTSPGGCVGDLQACTSNSNCCSFLCARSKCVPARPKNTLKEEFYGSLNRASRGN